MPTAVKGSLAPSFGPTHRNLVPDSWSPGLEFFLQLVTWLILFSDSPGWKVHPVQAPS